MQTETQTGASAPVFRPLEVKVTSTDPPADVLDKNVRHNMAQGWKRFHEREDWAINGLPIGKKTKPIAICAGGPSLKDFTGKIYDDFTDVMACGSAHDFLIKSGVDPTYSVQCDGAPIAKEFFKLLQVPNIQYLLASQCDPVMFEGLPREQVYLWHCARGDQPGDCDKDFASEPAIGGGCTVTLRAMNLAIMMGYHDLHFFGFDSSFEDIKAQHAYDYEEVGKNLELFEVRIDEGKIFKSNALFLAQAQQFQEMCGAFGHLFEPTVYGDGLIAEMIRVGRAKQEKAA